MTSALAHYAPQLINLCAAIILLLAFAMLIAILIFKPAGLLGKATIEKV